MSVLELFYLLSFGGGGDLLILQAISYSHLIPIRPQAVSIECALDTDLYGGKCLMLVQGSKSTVLDRALALDYDAL